MSNPVLKQATSSALSVVCARSLRGGARRGGGGGVEIADHVRFFQFNLMQQKCNVTKQSKQI